MKETINTCHDGHLIELVDAIAYGEMIGTCTRCGEKIIYGYDARDVWNVWKKNRTAQYPNRQRNDT